MLVAIDPGKHECGVAVFKDDGDLVKAFLLPREMRLDLECLTVRAVVLEVMRVYPDRQGKKVPPNDLIDVATAGAVLAGRCASYYTEVIGVYPRDWKGTMDGDAMTRRIAAYVASEKWDDRISYAGAKTHNILDAIGIGLWYFRKINTRLLPVKRSVL